MTPKTIVGAACLLGTFLAALAVPSQATAQVVYGLPPTGIYIRGYAPYPVNVYNPRRAYRQALRYGYPPLFQQWPLPAPVYGYPYHPLYGPMQSQVPTPAIPRIVPQTPPVPEGESPAMPEPIPAPPSEPGPSGP